MTYNHQERVLVAGATGTVGQAAVRHFEALGDSDAVALSRRTAHHTGTGRVQQMSLDLSDAGARRSAVGPCPPVTHVVYAALHEKPGLIAGWQDPEQMRTNPALLQSLIEPLIAGGGLQQVYARPLRQPGP